MALGPQTVVNKAVWLLEKMERGQRVPNSTGNLKNRVRENSIYNFSLISHVMLLGTTFIIHKLHLKK